jgi:ribosomal-protein-serine acetyltransferase
VLRLSLSDDCWLRFLEESDADELYARIDVNRAYLGQWLPWPADQTRDGTLEFIRSTRRQLAENNGLQTAIVCAEEIVGMVGLHGVDWAHRSASVGYWLDEAHQGKGTMTRAVQALVDHALHAWALNRVEIRAAADNARSRALAERLGFREEGLLREAFRIGERYDDDVVYAVLASEWDARSPRDAST